MSSPRYLTSLSDIIPFITQRRTGWVQFPALIGGKQNVYILNSKIVKEKNTCETKAQRKQNSGTHLKEIERE
jgi:hypothetical protein